LAKKGERIAMHTLILSLGGNNEDIREYTRESMQALEERMGHGLDWYAELGITFTKIRSTRMRIL
jgi:hypothetical protein